MLSLLYLSIFIVMSRAATLVPAAAPLVAVAPAPAQYSFGYDVQDAITGDSKTQVESRNGDIVQGQYSLNDPDGTRRIVDYTADPINGFNAVVRKAPIILAAEPLAAKTVAAVAAPPIVAAKSVAAPYPYTIY